MADDIMGALRSSELFGGLPDKRLTAIAEAGREVAFVPGEELVVEGDDAGRFFLIVAGSVEVTVGGVLRAVLGPGRGVGELALIDGGPRSATVTATSDVRAFSLASWNFRPFLAYPEVMTAVIGLLCQRLRSVDSRSRPPGA